MASEDLSSNLADFVADTDNVLHKIPELSEMNVENWNDATLMKLRKHIHFPIIRSENIKNILSRFYMFYFCGHIAEEDSVLAVVSDAVSLAKTKNRMLWDADAFSRNSFYYSDYVINYDYDIRLIQSYNFNNIIQYRSNEDEEGDYGTYERQIMKYTNINVCMFQDLIINSLYEMSPRFKIHKKCKLIGLTGFLALTLWRAVTNSEVELGNVFCTRRYRLQLRCLLGWSLRKEFSPPSKRCIRLALTHLRTGLASTSSMFIMLVAQYVKTRATAPDVANLLSEAVLISTARYRLEIIDLLSRVSRVTHLNWTELCKASYLNVTADTWDLIKSFFVTFLKRDSVEYSYNWARIIDDQYLKEYSLENVLPLAGIFVGILEHYEGNKIWNAKWTENHKEIFSEIKAFGKDIYTKSLES